VPELEDRGRLRHAVRYQPPRTLLADGDAQAAAHEVLGQRSTSQVPTNTTFPILHTFVRYFHKFCSFHKFRKNGSYQI
jgi:hypothetical protein